MANRARTLIWTAVALLIAAGLTARGETRSTVVSAFRRTQNPGQTARLVRLKPDATDFRDGLLKGASTPVGVASGASGPSQTQEKDQDPRPRFRAEANYVRVDVFPTRDGQPVLDLRQDEFEVLDEGVPQKIEQFEHIVIRGNVPQELRREPNSVAESRAMLEDARARVFVLFLDTFHVELAASRTIRQPLVEVLDRVIGVDDLVGVMTPRMSAADVTFARRTTTIQGMLDRSWWGERDALITKDPVEEQYQFCYPPPPGSLSPISRIAQEMIDRRREKMTLDALEDLVRFLRGVREERKAILVITDGWRLFGPNSSLINERTDNVPGLPPIGTDPRTGKLTLKDPRNPFAASMYDCDRDRLMLAQADTEQQFLRLLDEANRANASFYPVDPRGLVVFDSPIGPNRPPPLDVDAARLRARLTSLRTLAEATDGLAVVNTNDITGALTRVISDLSSYYLLGYYASNMKMDGKFHKVTVRVNRPGVQVRARRGYLAPTAAELTTRAGNGSAAPEAGASAAAAAEAHAIEAVVGPLAGFSRDLPLRVLVAAGWRPDNAATIWAVGEVGPGEEWKGGGEADVTLTSAAGATVSSARVRIEAGARSFRVALTASDALAPGEYAVRVRARGIAERSLPTSDVVRIALPSPPAAAGAVFVRRGPSTGNKEVATADLRFRRTEQLRVEVPTPVSSEARARLLDRTGKPLTMPIAAAVRDDGDGLRWLTAQLALAPLAVGDYVIELTARSGSLSGASGESRTLLAFRVVP